jgi:hypothetical protein
VGQEGQGRAVELLDLPEIDGERAFGRLPADLGEGRYDFGRPKTLRHDDRFAHFATGRTITV